MGIDVTDTHDCALLYEPKNASRVQETSYVMNIRSPSSHQFPSPIGESSVDTWVMCLFRESIIRVLFIDS